MVVVVSDVVVGDVQEKGASETALCNRYGTSTWQLYQYKMNDLHCTWYQVQGTCMYSTVPCTPRHVEETFAVMFVTML